MKFLNLTTFKKFVAITALVGFSLSAQAAKYVGSPFNAADVKSGKLPKVADRLPENPRVINLKSMGREPGKHGGTMRMLIGKIKDIKLIPIYGYARLVGYNEKFEIVPDILASIDVVEERIFTLHLRKGHKWSDGHPLTAEDFRYAWHDMLTDKKLGRSGLRPTLLVDGKGQCLKSLTRPPCVILGTHQIHNFYQPLPHPFRFIWLCLRIT